jgi:hypothetical protein
VIKLDESCHQCKWHFCGGLNFDHAFHQVIGFQLMHSVKAMKRLNKAIAPNRELGC